MPILRKDTINKGKTFPNTDNAIARLPLGEILTLTLLSSVILLGTSSHPSATQAFKITTEEKTVAFATAQFIPGQGL